MKDEGHTVDVIFLDFAKAFGNVNVWRNLSPLVLVTSACDGLKHTLLDGSREYMSVENSRTPLECAVVTRRAL